MEIAVPIGDLGGFGGLCPGHDLTRAIPLANELPQVPVKLAPDCGCNTTDEELLAQISLNIRRGLPQCQPMQPNTLYHALVVGGGASLEETKDELVHEYWAGHKIIAINGAYDWCIRNNLKPSAAVMLDAREFNSRFFERDVPGCKYLLASQCHPKAFETVRGREVLIWHALGSGSEAEHALLKDYYFGAFSAVTLGTTIGVRTISLMRMLGFVQQDIFGLDSCWLGDKHHAYAQPENDEDGRVRVFLRMKEHAEPIEFHCAPWHMKQTEDFQTLLKERGDLFRLNVRGRGLLATMMRTGASLQLIDEAGQNTKKEKAA